MTAPKPIGLMIRDLRLARGLTQVDLAERAGCTQAAVSDLERGRWPDPHWSTVGKFLGILGIDLPKKILEKIPK